MEDRDPLMQSKPQLRPPLRSLELGVRLAIVGILSWLLYTNFAPKPSALPALLTTSQRNLETGNVALARGEFAHYLSGHPRDPVAYQKVMEICLAAHRPDLAVRYGKDGGAACAQADPGDRAQLYLVLAEAYSDQGQALAPEASAAADQALNLIPNDPDALNARGYFLAESSTSPEDLQQARGLVTRALKELQDRASFSENDLTLSEFEDSYGWVLYREGLFGPQDLSTENFENSVDALLQAASDMPANAPADLAKTLYYHLGSAYAKLGRPQDARQALDVALHYDASYQDAKSLLQSLPQPPPTPPATVAPAAAHAAAGMADQGAKTPPAPSAFTPITTSGSPQPSS